MHNIIYFLRKKEIGTGYTVQQLELTYPYIFHAINFSIDKLPTKNRIWRIQNPYLYNFSCINRINDIIMIRKNFSKFFVGKKIVDGYSYYRKNIQFYKSWFPTIYQSNFEKNDYPSIGYYIRDFRIQSNYAFIDFIKNIPDEVPIITMGTKELLEKQLCNRKNWYHTYDNKTFWKKCSHYFYYRCSDFEDPFPQNLLEAIQSQHRIISPKDLNRTHIDGIDDFLSCIKYDEKFIEENIFGEYCEALESKTWKHYIEQIEHEDFQRPSILYNGLLYDWICKKL